MDADLKQQLEDLRANGLLKTERTITSSQGARIKLADGTTVINLCANNYLGLADSPDLIRAAQVALSKYGLGTASVRFICGTQDVHRALEQDLAKWLRYQDVVLFPSAFDANGGIFEALLDQQDAVISDELNHASIIDGIRLCKAERLRYAHRDLAALEDCLKRSATARRRLIVTDGVFSMDGTIAPLPGICDLAERHGAWVMVDDAHAHGVIGTHGRGSPEYCSVEGRVQIVTGTLGKALGGASGGFVASSAPVVEWLRNRARPYLFSNSIAPALAVAARHAVHIAARGSKLRRVLRDNTTTWRMELSRLGFDIPVGNHPIVPVMLGDARLAGEMAEALLEQGVYVTGFSYPVVPMGKARIRTQMSAAITPEDLEEALEAFAEVGRRLQVIGPPRAPRRARRS